MGFGGRLAGEWADNEPVRWTALGMVALVGCVATTPTTQSPSPRWDAPPVRLVSDLGDLEEPLSDSEFNAVSDGGRWVVFTWRRSFRRNRPDRHRLFLADTKRGRLRQIDRGLDGNAFEPQITPDGRFVVFASGFKGLYGVDLGSRTGLIPWFASFDELPGDLAVLVYDRVRGETEIVSRSGTGAEANGDSYQPAISANGRFVAFASRSTNLSSRDKDRDSDVYLRDLRKGTTELISVGAKGKSGEPDVSDDGNRVSFVSTSSDLIADVFVRDRRQETTTRVSVTSEGKEFETFKACESAGCWSEGAGHARISGNGEVVVFTAAANALVPEDQNFNEDVFVHEIDTHRTERVSLRDDGGEIYGPEQIECGQDPRCVGTSPAATHSPSVSRDGNLIYFISAASRITDEDDDDEAIPAPPNFNTTGSGEEVYVHNRDKGSTVAVSRFRDGRIAFAHNWAAGEISADGRWVTYANDKRRLDPRGDRDEGTDVFLQRLPRWLSSGS